MGLRSKIRITKLAITRIHFEMADKKALHSHLSVQLELPYQIIW